VQQTSVSVSASRTKRARKKSPSFCDTMSATSATMEAAALFESASAAAAGGSSAAANSAASAATAAGSVAHVSFRVRGESLGHGEEIFLVQHNHNTSATNTTGMVRCCCYFLKLYVHHTQRRSGDYYK
jgi:hypothetical protein